MNKKVNDYEIAAIDETVREAELKARQPQQEEEFKNEKARGKPILRQLKKIVE